MSFPEHRQNRLDPVLVALREVPGVFAVEQDDFDSRSINVFLTLWVETRNGCMTSSKRPYRFCKSIRSIKAAINRACNDAIPSWNELLSAKGWEFLDWPTKKYVSDGCGGKLDDGYIHEHIKIEVFV